MFWIKDREANLTNVERATDIRCCPCSDPNVPITPDRWEVQADFGSHQIILFVGSRPQCGHYRDELLRALKEQERSLENVAKLLAESLAAR